MECYEKVMTGLSVLFQLIGVVFLSVASAGVCLVAMAVLILVASAP